MTQLQIGLHFGFPNGEYRVAEQYYIYDMASFIADVGGYLVRSKFLIHSKGKARLCTSRVFVWVSVS